LIEWLINLEDQYQCKSLLKWEQNTIWSMSQKLTSERIKLRSLIKTDSKSSSMKNNVLNKWIIFFETEIWTIIFFYKTNRKTPKKKKNIKKKIKKKKKPLHHSCKLYIYIKMHCCNLVFLIIALRSIGKLRFDP